MKLIFMLFILFAGLSCKKGLPEVESLSQLSGFSVDQSVINLNSKNNSQLFVVSGRCNNNINQLEISFNNYVFEPLSAYSTSQSITCSTDNKFSFTVDPTKNSNFDITAETNRRTIYIRGFGEFGYTSHFNIIFQTNGSKSENTITAGSGISQPGVQYTLKGRIQAAATSSQNGYTLKGNIKIK